MLISCNFKQSLKMIAGKMIKPLTLKYDDNQPEFKHLEVYAEVI